MDLPEEYAAGFPYTGRGMPTGHSGHVAGAHKTHTY